MAKFMFVYRGGDDSEKSPEEMQQSMQVWLDWIEQGANAGWILDGGDALNAGGKIVHADNSVTDGPFAESKELVAGYSMIEAADLQAAVEYAKGSPMITQHGGAVEIRELRGVGQETA